MTKTTHPILIVEDDQATQTLMQTLMQRYGYSSVVAPDGQTAIDLLREGDFTAVVLDLMMPNVSGHDVIDFLAREKKSVPVVVCTAAGPTHTAGFDPSVVRAVLRKPFDIEVLMSTIVALV